VKLGKTILTALPLQPSSELETHDLGLSSGVGADIQGVVLRMSEERRRRIIIDYSPPGDKIFLH
jgi:hypothetical protein